MFRANRTKLAHPAGGRAARDLVQNPKKLGYTNTLLAASREADGGGEEEVESSSSSDDGNITITNSAPNITSEPSIYSVPTSPGPNSSVVETIVSQRQLQVARDHADEAKQAMIVVFTTGDGYKGGVALDCSLVLRLRYFVEEHRIGIQQGGVHFCHIDTTANSTESGLHDLLDPKFSHSQLPCVATFPYKGNKVTDYLTDQWALTNQDTLINYITHQAREGARVRYVEREKELKDRVETWCQEVARK